MEYIDVNSSLMLTLNASKDDIYMGRAERFEGAAKRTKLIHTVIRASFQ